MCFQLRAEKSRAFGLEAPTPIRARKPLRLRVVRKMIYELVVAWFERLPRVDRQLLLDTRARRKSAPALPARSSSGFRLPHRGCREFQFVALRGFTPDGSRAVGSKYRLTLVLSPGGFRVCSQAISLLHSIRAIFRRLEQMHQEI